MLLRPSPAPESALARILAALVLCLMLAVPAIAMAQDTDDADTGGTSVIVAIELPFEPPIEGPDAPYSVTFTPPEGVTIVDAGCANPRLAGLTCEVTIEDNVVTVTGAFPRPFAVAGRPVRVALTFGPDTPAGIQQITTCVTVGEGTSATPAAGDATCAGEESQLAIHTAATPATPEATETEAPATPEPTETVAPATPEATATATEAPTEPATPAPTETATAAPASPTSIIPIVIPTPTPEPTATAEPTATPSPTPEPTATPSPTPEPTATPSPTPEPTATPSPTPEPTATPSPTPEPTATPSPTPEPTATPSPTPEPTATPSPTPEPTATPSPTPEPTNTPTPEPTNTPTPEPTNTPTPEPTNTPTPEPTATPSPTPEPTPTPSPTPEPTATPSPTPEPTATPSPTPEPTATPSPTPEPTATPSPTPEATATAGLPIVGATGGTASFSVPITATQAPDQPADEPVSFTVIVDLPDNIDASAATCEVGGAACQAEVADGTVTATGAVPAGELAQQPQVTIDLTVPDAATAPQQPVAATACTVVGQPARPGAPCAGTQSEVSFSVAPSVSPTTTAGVVVLPGTGTGDDGGNLAMVLLGTLLAVAAAALAALAIRLRRT